MNSVNETRSKDLKTVKDVPFHRRPRYFSGLLSPDQGYDRRRGCRESGLSPPSLHRFTGTLEVNPSVILILGTGRSVTNFGRVSGYP